jgi:hypothetical protein
LQLLLSTRGRDFNIVFFFFLNAILAMSQKSGTLTLSNILWMLIPRSREPQLYGSAAQFLDPDQPRLLRCSGCSWNIYMDTYLCNEMSCNGMKQCIVMWCIAMSFNVVRCE